MYGFNGFIIPAPAQLVKGIFRKRLFVSRSAQKPPGKWLFPAYSSTNHTCASGGKKCFFEGFRKSGTSKIAFTAA